MPCTLSEQGNKWLIIYTAFFTKLQHLLGAAFLLACGVIGMHFSGMLAMYGAFRIEWDKRIVAVACVDAFVVSLAGLWILFRLLLWKVSHAVAQPVLYSSDVSASCCCHYQAALEWLRPVCGCVIALAVCSMVRIRWMKPFPCA